uniref:Uncharacterized protein n=1 Tax=Salix viminalis TaxID=40686 RepID=A0A6N2MT69_SALVM
MSGVHGALRCLALLDDIVVPTRVPVLFPCSHTIVSSPQTSTSIPSSVIALRGPRKSRQRGQVARLNPSHLSKQTLWKRWSHLNAVISSPSISHRQTAHSFDSRHPAAGLNSYGSRHSSSLLPGMSKC